MLEILVALHQKIILVLVLAPVLFQPYVHPLFLALALPLVLAWEDTERSWIRASHQAIALMLIPKKITFWASTSAFKSDKPMTEISTAA